MTAAGRRGEETARGNRERKLRGDQLHGEVSQNTKSVAVTGEVSQNTKSVTVTGEVSQNTKSVTVTGEVERQRGRNNDRFYRSIARRGSQEGGAPSR